MPETVHVWPGLNASGASITVYAEDGVTQIPAAGGAIVPVAPYYQELLAAGLLLDHNPTDSSGEPIDIVLEPVVVTDSPLTGEVLVATGSGTAAWQPSAATPVGAIASSISARPGVVDGEIVSTDGWSEYGDAPSGDYRFALGVSAGADGKTKINTSNGQYIRTRRLQNRRCIDVVEDFGVRESVADNGPAFNEAFTWCKANLKRSILLPMGDYQFATDIRFDNERTAFFGEGSDSKLIYNGTGYGLYAGSGNYFAATYRANRLANFMVYVNNASAKSAVRLQGFTRSRVEGLQLETNLALSGGEPYSTGIMSCAGTWVNRISGILATGFDKSLWHVKLNPSTDLPDATLNAQSYNGNVCDSSTFVFCNHGVVFGDPNAGETTLYLGAGYSLRNVVVEDAHEGAFWIASGFGVSLDHCYGESNSAFNVRIGSAAHGGATYKPRGTRVYRCEFSELSPTNVGVDVVRSQLAEIEQNYFYSAVSGVCVRLAAGADGTRIWDNYPASSSLTEVSGTGGNTDYRESARDGAVGSHRRKEIDSAIDQILESADVTVSGGVKHSPKTYLRAAYDSDTGAGVTSSIVEAVEQLVVTAAGSAPTGYIARTLVAGANVGGGYRVHIKSGAPLGGFQPLGRYIASSQTTAGYSTGSAIQSRNQVNAISSNLIGGVRTVTATPSIEAGQFDFQEFTVFNASTGASADTFRLQREGILSGSTLRLTADTVDIAPGQSVRFYWFNSQWVQAGPVIAVI